MPTYLPIFAASAHAGGEGAGDAVPRHWRICVCLACIKPTMPTYLPIFAALHMQVVKALVMLYHDFGQSGRAIEILEEQLAEHYASVDLTHINMLSDLYIGMVSMSGVGWCEIR
jgi:hypothetical protein